MKKIFAIISGVLLCSIIISLAGAQTSPLLPKLKTQLVPLQKVYKIGEPVNVKLDMSNLGYDTVQYDASGVGFNDSLVVIGPGERPMTYIAGLFQTRSSPTTLASNQTATLVDEWDVSSQYMMDIPGWYRVKFKGSYNEGIPASNVIEIELKPGEVKPMDVLLRKLLTILPKGWGVATGKSKKDFTNKFPLGDEVSVNGFTVAITKPDAPIMGGQVLRILVTDQFIGLDTMKKIPETTEIEYVGHNSMGYVYFLNANSDQLSVWTDGRDIVSKTILSL